MKLSRAVVVGGLAAGGLVLAFGSPASAHEWCDEDWRHDHGCYHTCSYSSHDHYEYNDNDILDLDLLNGIL